MPAATAQGIESTNRVVDSKKVWTSLITNTAYLSGLLTLDYSLKKHGSKFPMVALYTDTFPPEGHHALDIRGIPKQRVDYIMPKVDKDFSNDPRFYDCWSKLTPFSLTEYDRVVQLDSDMALFKNMDELMELELDPPEMEGRGNRVFAGSPACICNPMKKPHYPKHWRSEYCAYTSQHDDPDRAQTEGASPTFGLGFVNGGLQVVNPSTSIYRQIQTQMASDTCLDFDFADQSLLSSLFRGRWVSLPYVYNALKTSRDTHKAIWRDDEVRNLHYLLNPKPWDEEDGKESQETHRWWRQLNRERVTSEKEKDIVDGF